MVRKRSLVTILSVLILALFSTGCWLHYTSHPGALNTFDSKTYDSLLTAQAALDKAKAEYADGTISGDKVKAAINKAGEVYNELRDDWLAYRTLESSGKDTASMIATINAIIPQVSQAITDLQALVK